MAHRLFGKGRLWTVTLAGFALVIGASMRVRYSASSYAASSYSAVTGPDAPPIASAPRADRVAIDPNDPGETIEDSDSSELIALQRKFESVGRRVAPAVVSISA